MSNTENVMKNKGITENCDTTTLWSPYSSITLHTLQTDSCSIGLVQGQIVFAMDAFSDLVALVMAGESFTQKPE